MEEQPKEEDNSTLELYFVGFVFWLSNIINKCTFCFKEIYEENELVRNAIDCTVYISEYTCKQCSTKREEPMEKTWISTNHIHRYNETLVEEYLFLNIHLQHLVYLKKIHQLQHLRRHHSFWMYCVQTHHYCKIFHQHQCHHYLK